MDTLFCKKCNSEQEYYDTPNPPHVGAYCGFCDSWIKWLPQQVKHPTNVVLYFGKYKGTIIKDCTDTNYMQWIINNVDDLKPNIELALLLRIKELKGDSSDGR